jgi:hypothetical protein
VYEEIKHYPPVARRGSYIDICIFESFKEGAKLMNSLVQVSHLKYSVNVSQLLICFIYYGTH